MTWKECKNLIISDLSRLTPNQHNVIRYLFLNASFKITFYFRLGSYLGTKKNIILSLFYWIVFLIYKHEQYVTGIQLALGTSVQSGITFPHFFLYCNQWESKNR